MPIWHLKIKMVTFFLWKLFFKLFSLNHQKSIGGEILAILTWYTEEHASLLLRLLMLLLILLFFDKLAIKQNMRFCHVWAAFLGPSLLTQRTKNMRNQWRALNLWTLSGRVWSVLWCVLQQGSHHHYEWDCVCMCEVSRLGNC